MKSEPDASLAKGHIRKAEHNLEAFIYNKEKGYLDWTISMGFYAMYHCCLAILAMAGYESRNQECTLSMVSSMAERGEIDSAFIQYANAMKPNHSSEEEIIPLREKYQYTPAVDIDVLRVEKLLKACQDMIKDTKGMVERP